jgi:Zn-dependent membrane protease YugP
MKDSACAQNTIAAFYWEYSRYRYLYFTTGKQWSKDLLGNKGVAISQHTSIARSRGKGTDRNLYIMTLRG